jgi:hypothetical protein
MAAFEDWVVGQLNDDDDVGQEMGEDLEDLLGVGSYGGDVPDYMVGDDDDNGDGDDWENVGNNRMVTRRRTVPLAKLKYGIKAIAKQLQKERRKNKMLQMGAASKARNLPQIFLGLDSSDGGGAPILAGATRTVRTEPTTPLRITDLIVQAAFAADFSITRIDIGRLNLLAGGQPIPADAFISGVQRPPVEAPVLPAGTEAAITVVNNGGAARVFRAMFVGIDLQRARG